jgi:hypothetical protein
MTSHRTRWLGALLALAGLSACAQSAPPEQRNAMTSSQRPEPDARATELADAAAAASDRAAQAATTPSLPRAAQHAPPLRQGPTLAAADVRTRLFKLITSLHAPASTQAAHVEDMMGMQLRPEPDWPKAVKAQGLTAEGGSYWVRVVTQPNTPARDVEIGLFPPGVQNVEGTRAKTCSFELDELFAATDALGFRRSKGPSYQKERWNFSKTAPDGKWVFYLTADLYRSDDGSEGGHPCVVNLQIGAEESGASNV